MTLSILEHLDIKPRHIIGISAGMYYLLDLIPRYEQVALEIYLISPWVSISAKTRGRLKAALAAVIPKTVITARAIHPGRKYRLKEFLRGVFGISARQTPREGLTDEARWRALASPLCEVYTAFEDSGGNDQEIAQCLNKGGGDTGPSYLPSKLGCLRGHRVDIWFGGRDKLVEPRAQDWLEEQLAKLGVEHRVHSVSQANHDDLLWRPEGIYEIFDLIRSQRETIEVVSSQ